MTLRRAIRRHDDITAECPIEGSCQGVQITQGKMMAIGCGYYAGTRENKQELFVCCNYPESACSN